MASEQPSEGPDLSYREQNVEDDLNEHDRRISRLEKAVLIMVGYVLADQDMLIEAAIGLVL